MTMTAFNRIARRAVLAAVAASALCAAGAACAEVQLARSECRPDGYWHVRTYDVTDPDHWVLIEDRPTSQPCGEVRAREPERPSLDIRYRIEPRYDFRPTLRYHIEEQRHEKPAHVSMRYKF
jgi:hypothetical protein